MLRSGTPPRSRPSSNASSGKGRGLKDAENELMEVVLKANQACEEGQFVHAIHLYTEGLRIEPGNAMVFSNRSAAYLHAKDYQAALKDANHAIKLQPTWSKGYLRKGLALQQLHEYQSSVTTLAQGLAYETQSRQILVAIVESTLLSELRDSFDATQRQLRKLGLDQNPFVVLSAIGQELLSAGQFKTALIVLNCAKQIDTDNLRLKGSLMSALASAHWKLGNHKQSICYMEEDLAICRSLGDQHGECRVIGNLGNASYTTRLYDDAIQYHKDQLLLATDIKSRKTAALALGSLGHTYSAVGEHNQALACHEQCLALAKEMGNRVSEAEEYGNIGCLYLTKGDHTTSLQYHEHHLSLAQEIGNIPQQTKAYFNMATVYQHIHDYSEALKCYQVLLTLAVKCKDRVVEMRAYAGMGACTKHIGELTMSLTYYEQNLSLALKVADNGAISKAYCCLGNVNQALGKLSEALEAHRNHLVKVLELRDRAAEGRVYGNLGNVHCAMGHYHKAVKLHEQALAIASEVGDVRSEAATNGNLGIAYQGLCDEVTALRHLDTHLTISRDYGDKDGQLKALSNLGNFHANKNTFSTARELFQEQLEMGQDRGDIETQCKALNSIATLYKLEGKLHLSLEPALQSVNLSAQRPRLLVKNLIVLAKLYLTRGEYSNARGTLQRAYDASTSSDTQRCLVLSELATASLYCGYVDTALDLYSTLSELAAEQKLFKYEMISQAGYGHINLLNGLYGRAKDYFERAISMCKDTCSTPKEELHQHLNISRVCCSLRQYEDAHSALVSAKELLPHKALLNQEDKCLVAELCSGFGDLSLAKGDYGDALEHYKEETSLLVGEDQIRQTQNIVPCLWCLGSGYQAFQILDTLEDKCTAQSPYLSVSLLDLRAKLYNNIGCFSDAIHQHEVRLDIIRRQGDRVMELSVLQDLGTAYFLEGHFDQALVTFDQELMISRDISHVLGECQALVGMAKSYFSMAEFETALSLCDQVDDTNNIFTRLLCESYLVRARSYLELSDTQESIKYSRLCVERAGLHPILVATATAILGHGLVKSNDEAGGEEALISSCSQFEIILLQRNINFIYELASPIQEYSYSLLFDLQQKPSDRIMIYEKTLRWERSKYLPPSSPFPALHTSGQFLRDISSVLGETGVAVVARVDQTRVHTWCISSEGLSDYQCTVEVSRDTCSDVILESILSHVKKCLSDVSTLYLVLSEELVSPYLLEQVRTEHNTPVSVCGCLDDLARCIHEKRDEKSITPGVLLSHDVLHTTCHAIQGKGYENFQNLSSYHMFHMSCEMLSYSQLDPDLIYIGDIAAECLVLHNTSGMLYEEMSRLCLSLLPNVRCVVAQMASSPDLQTFYKNLHNNIAHGDSIIRAAATASNCLEDDHVVQIYGCDWLPRQPCHVTGVRLLLRSASECSSAVRATLEIIDKIRTGFNRDGPITIQHDILGSVLGWDEILYTLGATLDHDTVVYSTDEVPDTDEIRTLLTALLECGEALCKEIVGLLYTNNINTIIQLIELLELYISITPDNTTPPTLPLPDDVYNATSSLLKGIGLLNTEHVVSGNVLLSLSHDTSLVRIEAVVHVLNALFDLGSPSENQYNREDDVGAIEI